MYCEHHRTVGACEDCAYTASVDAGRPMEGLFRAAAAREASPDAATEADRPPPDKPQPKAH